MRSLNRHEPDTLSFRFGRNRGSNCPGCVVTRPVKVSVNSYSSYEALTLKRFSILPGNKGVSEFDLDFMETKDAVERALLAKGFQRAEKPNQSEIVIFLSYGIGLPQTQTQTYQMPVYGQVAGGTSTVNATVFGPRGPSVVTGTITQPPVYGVTGHQTTTSTTTTFTRWMRVDAVNVPEYIRSKVMKSVWDTRMISTGTNGDLREIIPVMVDAGAQYFGQSTGRSVDVIIRR